MAQDYDSPRNKDEDEESLQALGKSSQNTSNDMDDDAERHRRRLRAARCGPQQ